MSKDHHLKIEPEHLNRLLDGTKKAEVRYNDRLYQVGDYLHFVENGITHDFEITHILPLGKVPGLARKVCPEIDDEEFGHDVSVQCMEDCLNDWVVLSLEPIGGEGRW